MMNDFISREAVIKAVDDYTLTNCPKYMHDWATNLKRAILEDVKSDIDNIPAADVQPVKRARWIIRKCRMLPYCSACGSEPVAAIMTKHCPNCGALMQEEG